MLGAVKTEFGKFGGMLDKARAQTETVLKTLTDGDIRKRAMDRTLRQVEGLPDAQSQALLPLDKEPDEG